jgi:predicted RNase H-like nuclease (RuvC/YqgF family)
MGKILTIVTIALAAITAGLGFLNRGTLVETKGKLADTETQLTATRESLAKTSAELEASKKTVADLTTKNDLAQSEITKLKAENQTKDSKIAELDTKITESESALEELKTTIASLEQENSSLKETAAQVDAPAEDESKARIAELETLNNKLDSDLKTAEARIQTMEERLNEKKRLEKLNNLSGRILAVNEAWNFVVLNLGDKNGIASNTELLVKRGSTQIGRVRVTSVEPSSSIADIVPGSLSRGLSIQPGDFVITQYAAN